jgi:hypothetical protein
MHRSEKFEARTRFFYININRDVKATDVNKSLYVEILTFWKPSELLAMRELYNMKVKEVVSKSERDDSIPVSVPKSERDDLATKSEPAPNYKPPPVPSSKDRVDYEKGRVSSPKPRRLSIGDSDTEGLFSEYESDGGDLKSEIIRNSKRSTFKKKLFGKNAIKHRLEHDQRLPSFICQHALLCGGVGGSVCVIPRGEPGSVLMFTSAGPAWVKADEEE